MIYILCMSRCIYIYVCICTHIIYILYVARAIRARAGTFCDLANCSKYSSKGPLFSAVRSLNPTKKKNVFSHLVAGALAIVCYIMTKYGALLLEYRALLKDKAVFLREVHRRCLVESMYACECVFCVYAYVYICAHTNTCCACIHRCIYVCM